MLRWDMDALPDMCICERCPAMVCHGLPVTIGVAQQTHGEHPTHGRHHGRQGPDRARHSAPVLGHQLKSVEHSASLYWLVLFAKAACRARLGPSWPLVYGAQCPFGHGTMARQQLHVPQATLSGQLKPALSYVLCICYYVSRYDHSADAALC